MQKKGGPEQPFKKRAVFIEEINKSDDEYTVCLNLCDAPTPSIQSHAVCFNVRATRGACVDSGSPVDLTNNPAHANLTLGNKVYLEGILPGKVAVEPALCEFHTVNTDEQLTIIRTGGKGLYHTGATSKILSLTMMLSAGYRVYFETGRSGDP